MIGAVVSRGALVVADVVAGSGCSTAVMGRRRVGAARSVQHHRSGGVGMGSECGIGPSVAVVRLSALKKEGAFEREVVHFGGLMNDLDILQMGQD